MNSKLLSNSFVRALQCRDFVPRFIHAPVPSFLSFLCYSRSNFRPVELIKSVGLSRVMILSLLADWTYTSLNFTYWYTMDKKETTSSELKYLQTVMKNPQIWLQWHLWLKLFQIINFFQLIVSFFAKFTQINVNQIYKYSVDDILHCIYLNINVSMQIFIEK